VFNVTNYNSHYLGLEAEHIDMCEIADKPVTVATLPPFQEQAQNHTEATK